MWEAARIINRIRIYDGNNADTYIFFKKHLSCPRILLQYIMFFFAIYFSFLCLFNVSSLRFSYILFYRFCFFSVSFSIPLSFSASSYFFKIKFVIFMENRLCRELNLNLKAYSRIFFIFLGDIFHLSQLYVTAYFSQEYSTSVTSASPLCQVLRSKFHLQQKLGGDSAIPCRFKSLFSRFSCA